MDDELKKLEDTESVRKKTLKEYGTGDLNSSKFKSGENSESES